MQGNVGHTLGVNFDFQINGARGFSITDRKRSIALVLSLLAFLPGAHLPAQASFSASDNLVLTVDTNLGSNQFILPFSEAGGFNVSVDWGDGTYSNSATVNPDHIYGSEGTYTVTVTNNGSNLLHFGNAQDARESDESPWSLNRTLTAVNHFPSWINSYEEAFYGASNLVSVPPAIPPGVVNMRSMFYDASSFNSDVSGWDTSSVTNMSDMFSRATTMNADISAWDTSSVTNMSNMFSYASDFNGDLSSWNTAAVTTMESMFEIASSFSSDISGWDTSNATNFGNMFRSAASFNINLDSWNTANVTNMYQMFSGESAMEYCLPSWNLWTRTGTNMTGMFGPEYSNAGCVEAVFASEGGSPVASYSYKAIYALPAPSTNSAKTNANFLGWATESAGLSVSFPVLAISLDPTIDLSSSSLVTFFAVWESTLGATPSPSSPTAEPSVYLGPVVTSFSNVSVFAGESVTIYGRRLASINSFAIDGLEVDISSKSETSLVVSIPITVDSGIKDLVAIGAFGKLTIMDALTILVVEVEPISDSTLNKVNVGAFNGSVAIYAKGYEGRTLSWKIAGRWVKTLVNSDYQVLFRKTRDIGLDVLVELYIDGDLKLATSVTTR